MIPASGEFAYATRGIRKGGGGSSEPENLNALTDTADMVVALDRLQAMAPNVESVSLVVAWFGDDLRAGSCKVRPGVEVTAKTTTPSAWSVDGVSRADAFLVSRDDQDRPVYGGTPADFAVVQAIQEMKARGLRVTFYPFILMDVPPGNTLPNPYSDNAADTGQPAFPWRGRITCSPAAGYAGTVDKTGTAASQVAALFGAATPASFSVSGQSVSWTGAANDWGLRRMVLHYAHLCATAGGVRRLPHRDRDAGADDDPLGRIHLSGRAGLSGSSRRCPLDPRVRIKDRLRRRLERVFRAPAGPMARATCSSTSTRSGPIRRSILSASTITCRSPTGGTASSMRMPPRAGPRSTTGPTCRATSRGGEGFDWFYASVADRSAQVRTPITDGAAAKPWVFRYKDLRAWWSNAHYDRPGGVESGTPTAWAPQSKPIWFTELGCPAIDRGTNQPNVFFDPKSSESFTPHFSRGWRDDAIQRAYLEATYLWWGEAVNNPLSSVYGGRMVHVPECAAWTWDARPYPFFRRSPMSGRTARTGGWATG